MKELRFAIPSTTTKILIPKSTLDEFDFDIIQIDILSAERSHILPSHGTTTALLDQLVKRE